MFGLLVADVGAGVMDGQTCSEYECGVGCVVWSSVVRSLLEAKDDLQAALVLSSDAHVFLTWPMAWWRVMRR